MSAPTYTVKPLVLGDLGLIHGLTHGVYSNDTDASAITFCCGEADAHQVAEALSNYPDALEVVRKLHALNTSTHNWDDALKLDLEIRQLTARLLGVPLDSPSEKADDNR